MFQKPMVWRQRSHAKNVKSTFFEKGSQRLRGVGFQGEARQKKYRQVQKDCDTMPPKKEDVIGKSILC